MGFIASLKRLLSVAILMLAGMCTALVLVNLIPNDRIMSHLRSSMSATNYQPSQLGFGKVDFWGECSAASMGVGTKADELPLVARSFLSPTIGNCERFQNYLGGNTSVGHNYWRYWHGYQIFSRPILYVANLNQVHYVLVLLFVFSAAFFAIQVARFSRACSWSFVIALFCAPVAAQITMLPHFMVWVLAFSIGGWLLRPASRARAEELDGEYLWFLVLGMLCCFFDLFTVPLITLTVPLLGLYWKGECDSGSRKLTLRSMLILSTLWLAGYSICWATKWLIAGAILGKGAATEISNVIQHRIGVGSGPLGDEGQEFSVSAAASILDNARQCWPGLLAISGLTIARIRPITAAVRSNMRRSSSTLAMPLMLFLMPLVWLAIVKQHSMWHAWFVARIYFSSFAMLIAFILAPQSRSGIQA